MIYNGLSEASMTPPGWNGWLHHTVDTPPTEEDYTPREWERPHMGNPTGTPAAIVPKGSMLRHGRRQASDGRLPGLVAGRLSAAPSFRPALPSRGDAQRAR